MTELERDLEALAHTLRASTVAVRAERDAGAGSGVVWSADGTIVTNAHVAVSRSVTIELADGRRYPGTVVRRDAAADLAAVRIAATDLQAAQFRDPGDVRVGELLVAFGHPLGVRNVLTTGIAFAPHQARSGRFLRADLRLAPGNSGGPLADCAGRVLGISSMVAGGLALAIPTGDVRRFMGSGTGEQRLGVRVAVVERSGSRAYAVLAVEPDSRAERAGLIPGDLIVRRDLDGMAVATSLEVLRGGVRRTVAIVRSAGGIDAAA